MSKRIKELSDKIINARIAYYNKQPTMTDAAYDILYDELKKLDPDHLAITAIGAPVVSEWEKVNHTVPMQSLNKAQTIDEFNIWTKSTSAKNLFLCEKLDGLSVSAIWENGKLTQACTRGDGHIGEDITVNVRKMKGVPEKLDSKFTGVLRGEILLTISDHKKHFSDLANPRNSASGIAKRYDGQGAEHLSVMFYTVSSGKDFTTEAQQFQFLQSLGLKTPNFYECKNADSVIELYNKYQNSIRDSLDYIIDGLVVRLNDISHQLSFGEKNHRPAGAIAFKFEAEAKETTIRAIVWQVGNSGRITPVAEFDTVELAGAKVSRASLYNYSNIKELGIDIGAKIIVVRAGDVIPRIDEVSHSTGTIAHCPTACPSCNATTKFNGEYLICPNRKGCPAQIVGQLQQWINENNILDWSQATLQKVVDSGLVSDVADLYKLKAEDLAKLDRMGEKSAQNLVGILDKHRNISLQNIIGGLGIEGVATSTAKLVIDAGYNTLNDIFAMSVAQYEAIPGFGYVRARAFYHGLNVNKERIKNILAAGVTIKAKPHGKLSRLSFCFTGSGGMPRAQLAKIVEDNGGDVKKSVGKGLDFLVTADEDSTSNKAQAAKKFGTKVISEQKLLDMIK